MPYGESWECAAFKSYDSKILDGWGKGLYFSQLLTAHGKDIVGKISKEFPLLIKLIDAAKALSIQVHPGDEDLVDECKMRAKNEAWVILKAEADACIWLGFKDNISDAEARQLIGEPPVDQLQTDRRLVHEQIDGDALVASLRKLRVRSGDIINVPAGTVHAIGGGILLAEVQQASDTTFRIFDWDQRKTAGAKRELHLSEARQVIRPSQRPAIARGDLHTPYFRMSHRMRFDPSSLSIYNTAILLMSLSPHSHQLSVGSFRTVLNPFDLVLLPQKTIQEKESVRISSPQTSSYDNNINKDEGYIEHLIISLT